MALRKSGNVTVRLHYDDAKQGYVCVVSAGGSSRRILVGEPKHLTQGVDSPGAYDDAARAAISFAINEGLDSAYPDPDSEGASYALKRGK